MLTGSLSHLVVSRSAGKSSGGGYLINKNLNVESARLWDIIINEYTQSYYVDYQEIF